MDWKTKGHRITAVEEESAAWELGIEPGMYLVSVNGFPVEDVFDYRFRMADEECTVRIREENGEESEVQVHLETGEDFGLSFENGLMSSYRSCCNHCIFCFIDQMPPGMRETLYFKDDDSRLSFLQGNYVTLTNLSEHDLDRIIRYRMEPINISVHTTNPELRVRMLRNRFAGEALGKMKRLKDAGISMNAQIVLCKGWNDGEELERTIRDLTGYLPELKSVSVVPVGLSRFREGLEPLEPFTPAEAGRVIDCIEAWQKRIRDGLSKSCGSGAADEDADSVSLCHLVHASDEWYILAGRPLPEEERYDGFLQYENGVGMLRLLINETHSALEAYKKSFSNGEFALPQSRSVTCVCGKLPAPYLTELLKEAEEAFPGCRARVLPIRNDYFGEGITVTGLLTGTDLIHQLSARLAGGEDLGEELLISSAMLRRGENVFLDDKTTEDVSSALGLPLRVVQDGGEALIRAVLGLPDSSDHDWQNYEVPDRDPGL